MTLGLDILLLSVDPNLRIVREREYTGYAMRAADLIELAVARRVETRGRWSDWIHVLDARPTGEPLLDASLASLATSRTRVDATGWMCRQPGQGVVTDGLALLEAQQAVRLYSRRPEQTADAHRASAAGLPLRPGGPAHVQGSSARQTGHGPG